MRWVAVLLLPADESPGDVVLAHAQYSVDLDVEWQPCSGSPYIPTSHPFGLPPAYLLPSITKPFTVPPRRKLGEVEVGRGVSISFILYLASYLQEILQDCFTTNLLVTKSLALNLLPHLQGLTA